MSLNTLIDITTMDTIPFLSFDYTTIITPSIPTYDYIKNNEFIDFDDLIQFSLYDYETKCILNFINECIFVELELSTREGKKINENPDSKLCKFLRSIGFINQFDQIMILIAFENCEKIFYDYLWAILFENFGKECIDEKTKPFNQVRKEYFDLRNKFTLTKYHNIYDLFYKYREIIISIQRGSI